MVTEIGEGVSSGQIKLSGPLWTLSPLPYEFCGNIEYQTPREFLNFLTEGKTQNFDFG
jgi:hypothetical protein